MKNVLLLGDSIRMQYTPKVKELLKGRANVYGPWDNGRWSDYTLNSLRFWLPQLPDPDIVHWNNGIWDMGDDYDEGFPHVSLKDYEQNVVRIFRVLRKMISPDIQIIAATTIPWVKADIAQLEAYNDAIRRAAAQEGVALDDLYTPFFPQRDKLIGPDQVHMNPDGIELVGGIVAKAIEPYLD